MVYDLITVRPWAEVTWFPSSFANEKEVYMRELMHLCAASLGLRLQQNPLRY